MTSFLKHLSLLVLLSLFHVSSACYSTNGSYSTCEEKITEHYNLFGTKTTYEHATGLSNGSANSFNVEGCTPLLLMLFMRHTTRYPNVKDMKKFEGRITELRDQMLEAERNNCSMLCQTHLRQLRAWRFKWSTKDENAVTLSGLRDTKLIATRYQKMFPSLLPKTFSENDYKILVTSKARTRDTASAFMSELLNKQEFKKVDFAGINDELLDFHSFCEDLLKKKGVSKQKVEEEERFFNGSYVRNMVTSLSERTGVNLEIKDIELMAKLCAFEVALKGSSPFCNLFRKEDLQLLEYAGDLDDYYKDGYGHERNSAQACGVIGEFVSRIEERVGTTTCDDSRRRRRELKASLYFSHAGAIKKLMTRLGIHKDKEPLTADAYCDARKTREWRSSFYAPFTANLGIVLFRCEGSPPYKVVALLNEKVVRIDGCPDDVCPLTDFLKTSGVVRSSCCDLEKICDPNWDPSSNVDSGAE
ncbi:multiple inositol polyphosphate phosphatase 1-like [Ixodes scapularis]|uniref:multiple inositol polyphosphate phosphatase 1-like n=1 Tax=Ixodes scapularis TaxID=6945 RepID=UPI001C38969C|nr:multiple inositol polyphosphate phosphatase 1-like [Ixodes scapularis]